MEKNWRNRLAFWGFSGMTLGAGLQFIGSLGQDTWCVYLYMLAMAFFALSARVVMQGGDPFISRYISIERLNIFRTWIKGI